MSIRKLSHAFLAELNHALAFLILSLHQLIERYVDTESHLELPVVIYDCVVMWQGRTYPVVLFNSLPTNDAYMTHILD